MKKKLLHYNINKTPKISFFVNFSNKKKVGEIYIMVNIKVREGETIEEAIRRFKRECEKNGIMQEIKRREFYKPPSIVKKEKLSEIKRKIRRKMLKENRWYK